MKNIIIGRRSNLTNCLSKMHNNFDIVSSTEVLNSDLKRFFKNYQGEINIIFNAFFPLHLMKNFNHKIFYERSQLVSLIFLEKLTSIIKKNKKIFIKKLIISSSSSIYKLLDTPDHQSFRHLYASIKLSNESLFLDFASNNNISLILARIFNIYGRKDKFSILQKIRESFVHKKKLIINNNGESIRDFIHVDDVCKIYNYLLKSKYSGVIDVGTGVGHSVNNIINFVGKKNLNITYNKSDIDFSDISIANINNLSNIYDTNSLRKLEEYLKLNYKNLNKNKLINSNLRDNKKSILLSPPNVGNYEKRLVEEAINSNWIAPVGPYVNRFENQLSKRLLNFNVAVLNSGTAAMHLALKVLGVKKNDFVLCQSFTFIGSANPIIYLEAEPVFIDSEKDTWNMDPQLLEKSIIDLIKINKKPKAIIVVDLYGMPANYYKLLKISKKYSVPIIEDAAESLGSNLNGKPCGTFGAMGILSFNGNKIITTGGGGAIVSRNKKFIEKAKFLSTQAREKKNYYEHNEIGYNYRLSNISASIGLAQLKSLDTFIVKRNNIYGVYSKALSQFKDIKFQSCSNTKNYIFSSNRWLTTFYINKPHIKRKLQNIIENLNKKNIEARPLWKPMHMQPIFKNKKFYTNGVSRKLFESGLCLPSGSNLSKDEMDYVCYSLIQLLDKI